MEEAVDTEADGIMTTERARSADNVSQPLAPDERLRDSGLLALVGEEGDLARFSTTDKNDAAPVFGGQDDLDMLVVTRTARTLSEETVFERLLETLIKDVLAYAGARYGALLLMYDGLSRVAAAGRVVDGEVVVETGATKPVDDQVPLSILQTVVRTCKLVVLGNAEFQAPSRGGESLGHYSVGSALCIPLLKQGTLIGVLYLENSFVKDVFSSRKVATLEVLASQAANALETARLDAALVAENRRRRDTEDALRAARAGLARASRLTLMGEFAASIAHEINQPLSGIVSSVGASLRWLQADQPNIEEVRASLENIRNAGQRAAEIVRALRALAKQEPAVLGSLDIDDLIREVLALASAEIGKRRVRLIARLDAASTRVFADRTQLQQVVLNLVTNALDAIDNIESPRELVVTSGVRDRSVIVSVRDTGGGVPEPILRRIFDPFFTTKDNGMGMGLSICRSVMEAHGGTLEVVATSEVGSTFMFTLPAGPAL